MTAAQILSLLQPAAGHHAWVVTALGVLWFVVRCGVWVYTKVSDQHLRERYMANIQSEEGSLRAMEIDARRERDRRWLPRGRGREDEDHRSGPSG